MDACLSTPCRHNVQRHLQYIQLSSTQGLVERLLRILPAGKEMDTYEVGVFSHLVSACQLASRVEDGRISSILSAFDMYITFTTLHSIGVIAADIAGSE